MTKEEYARVKEILNNYSEIMKIVIRATEGKITTQVAIEQIVYLMLEVAPKNTKE
jgi:hypothetical protein